MFIEQIIEFQFRGPGPLGLYMYSYNWLTSWQNKNLEGKIFERKNLFTAEILPEAMWLTSPYMDQITFN